MWNTHLPVHEDETASVKPYSVTSPCAETRFLTMVKPTLLNIIHYKPLFLSCAKLGNTSTGHWVMFCSDSFETQAWCSRE